MLRYDMPFPGCESERPYDWLMEVATEIVQRQWAQAVRERANPPAQVSQHPQ